MILSKVISDNLNSSVKLVKASVIIGFLTGIALSPKLWLNKGRSFPMIAPIDGIPQLVYPFDIILLIIFIGLSLIWIFSEDRRIGILTAGSLLLLLVQDQMRWQPWVYMYLLMMIPYLTLSKKTDRDESIIICLQWILIGVYMWSGLHKLNTGFLEGPFKQMMTLFGLSTDFNKWKAIGYALPLFEIFTGVALMTPALKKTGIFAAIFIHVAILIYLSPLLVNHNSVVYPWNVIMICLVLLLFWNTRYNLFNTLRKVRSNVSTVMVIVLVWIFPILNYFGHWHHYLSFSLYSNKPSNFYIAVASGAVNKIDRKLKNYFADIPGLQGGQIIDIDKWAFDELNVPFYPELSLFKKLSINFCNLGIEEDKIMFLELFYKNQKAGYHNYTCRELNWGNPWKSINK